jgi:hypothetical protein
VADGDLLERLDALGEQVGDEVSGDAAVVGGGDDGDPGAFRVVGEGVEDRFGVELLAGGVDVVAAGRDGRPDHGEPGTRERSGAVDDRVAAAEGCHEAVVVVGVGYPLLGAACSHCRRGHAQARDVAADEHHVEVAAGQFREDELSLVAACAVDGDLHVDLLVRAMSDVVRAGGSARS